MGWLDKLKQGMKKTAAKLSGVSTTDLESLEEALILADIGVQTAHDLTEAIKKEKSEKVKEKLFEILVQKLTPIAKPLEVRKSDIPFIILMTGVNGAGKTTTIGKLAHQYKSQGYSVAMIAADTFRAGASEQLQRWAERTQSPIFVGAENEDPAALVYKSLETIRKNPVDIVFIDTAGRLQNKTGLMQELAKIRRIIQKHYENAPQETILVLDGTSGQNILSQVKLFKEACPLTGLIMTKLDGSAKGGVLVALADTFKLPVYALGVGEGIEDLNAFTANDYVQALLENVK
ncbi:MAG: signal recognition particle-docking protein FtsY [Alphaproteobacteria bacterium]|nr:signal recognition particle-docking protein FtsY [Alphaproteobacteria bacterium]